MNGVILVNKPIDFTSRDVVNKLNRILNTKKIGHTGTLDPLATGVMVICVGNCTKLVDLLTSKDKEYVATVKLGIKTDTGDITGNIIEKKDYSVDKEKVINILNSFLGESVQTVPIYSAVKVNGKKLYEYARNSEDVELPKRNINISDIELLEYNEDSFKFRVVVSKGTYIRSLIEDICYKLDTVGTMSGLERTKQGIFDISKCSTLEEIENNNYELFSLEEILSDFPYIDIDDDTYNKVKNGAVIDKNFDTELCVFKYNNKVVSIYKQYDGDCTKVKPYKMF